MYILYIHTYVYIYLSNHHPCSHLRPMVASIRGLIPKSPANRDESDNVNDLTNWEFHYSLEVQSTKRSGWSKKDAPYFKDSRSYLCCKVWSAWTPWVFESETKPGHPLQKGLKSPLFITMSVFRSWCAQLLKSSGKMKAWKRGLGWVF